MTDGKRSDAQVGRDCGKRLEHEAALRELRMRHGEPARAETSAAPQNDVEIEHTRAPAAAAAATEFALDGLDVAKHFGRPEIAFHQRHSVGKVAASATMGRIENDRRGVKQSEILVEPRDRRLDHLRRAAVAAVRAVRPDRDGVEA